MAGWVKIHRTILEKGWSNKPDFVALWVFILLQASHEKREYFWNGKNIILNPGQFISGRLKIAANTGIQESKVERILKCFESEQQIEQLKTASSRLITIVNWKEYQESEQPFEQRVNNKRTTSEQPVNTKQELKNERMKECKPINRFTVPAQVDIEKYIFQNHTEFDQVKVTSVAGAFFDYYTANGWKVGKSTMKDWQAALRNWLRNEKKFEGKSNGANGQPDKRTIVY